MSAYEEGNPNAKIVLIGEAPSTEELRADRPFVGPAGTLLEQCLHGAGIARSDCYIINVFEDRVYTKSDDHDVLYDDSGRKLWTSSGGFTELGLSSAQGCIERIKSCSANVLVPLGNVAKMLVTGSGAITKWRGSILTSTLELNARKTVPSIHPSGALRGMYVWRYLIAADLKRAKLESTSALVILPQRNLLIEPTFAQVIDFFAECLTRRAFATDIEVLNGQVDCLSLAYDPLNAICIPFLDADWDSYWTLEEETEIWRLYAELLACPEITKINQNITFDLAALLWLNNLVPCGRLHDPMVAHSVSNPALSKSLGTICSLYTREPYYKDDGDLHDAPTIKDFQGRWIYNAKDSAIALEAWLALKPLIEADGTRPTYDRTIAVIPALVEMMVRGFRVNITELHATRDRVVKEIAEITVKIAASIGRGVITAAPKTAADKRAAAGMLNINSPAQMMGYFYKELGHAPYTKQGKPTLDDKALARLARKGVMAAKHLQEFRSRSKLLSTYLEVKLDPDFRLRCSYNPRGTWTGRLSSSQTVFETGLNMQNIHPAFRSFMQCDAGVEAECSVTTEHLQANSPTCQEVPGTA